MAIYIEGLILLVAIALGGLAGYTWEHRHTVALQSAFKDLQKQSKQTEKDLGVLSAKTQDEAASAAQELRDKTGLIQAQQAQYSFVHADVVASASKQIAALVIEKQQLKDTWTKTVAAGGDSMPILVQIDKVNTEQRGLECLQAQVPGALAEQLNSITGAP